MKRILILFLSLFITFTLFNCSKDNSPSGPTYIASEVWSFIYNNDSSLKYFNNFKKNTGGSVVIAGTWILKKDTSKVICPFFDSPVSFINDSTLHFIGNGNAYCNGFPPGQQNSTFNLSVEGIFKNGIATGNWSITFSSPYWPPSALGTFSASRTNGSGITP